MKMRTLTVFIFLMMGVSCFAQVELGLTIDRSDYIAYEAISARLTVVNNSGRQLVFGNTKHSGGLSFQVVDRNRNSIDAFRKSLNPLAGQILGAGETRTLTFSLNSFFPLARADKYRVRAVLSHSSIPGLFVTSWQSFNIRKPYTIEKRSFGVSKGNGDSKIYHYEIVGFSQMSGDIYCLKIYDDKLLYAFHRIGPKVRGIKLQHDVDAFGDVHVLVQEKPKLFRYKVFTHKGEVKLSRQYKATFESVPKLYRDFEVGKVSVIGGIALTK